MKLKYNVIEVVNWWYNDNIILKNLIILSTGFFSYFRFHSLFSTWFTAYPINQYFSPPFDK